MRALAWCGFREVKGEQESGRDSVIGTREYKCEVEADGRGAKSGGTLARCQVKDLCWIGPRLEVFSVVGLRVRSEEKADRKLQSREGLWQVVR